MSTGQIAHKDDWVQIYDVILPVGERAPQVPEETSKVPLEMFVKGFLLEDSAVIGDMVTVRTAVDRVLKGKMVAINPSHTYNFGEYVPELSHVGQQARRILREAGYAR